MSSINDWKAVNHQALMMAQRRYGAIDVPVSYVRDAIRELRAADEKMECKTNIDGDEQ